MERYCVGDKDNGFGIGLYICHQYSSACQRKDSFSSIYRFFLFLAKMVQGAACVSSLLCSVFVPPLSFHGLSDFARGTLIFADSLFANTC